MTREEIEDQAAKLLKDVRKLKKQIDEKEAEHKEEMAPILDRYRAKYTRLNQLAKQLKKEVHEL